MRYYWKWCHKILLTILLNHPSNYACILKIFWEYLLLYRFVEKIIFHIQQKNLYDSYISTKIILRYRKAKHKFYFVIYYGISYISFTLNILWPVCKKIFSLDKYILINKKFDSNIYTISGKLRPACENTGYKI